MLSTGNFYYIYSLTFTQNDTKNLSFNSLKPIFKMKKITFIHQIINVK